MKFSYNWIRELVRGPLAGPRELARLITMKTAECEGIEEVGLALADASIAEVLEVQPIADSHNQRVRIRTARHGERVVVCGAPNCVAGMRSVYSPVGLKVIDGVSSDGMLAGERDLGVGKDQRGILETDSLDRLTPDAVIEVDNKSLTHRPDLWGHLGLAREVAAIQQGELVDPVDLSLLPTGKSPLKIEIGDHGLCPRYSALVLEDVTVQPSPLWLRWRLESIGLNPINNIVDVTNFVMAELAQPMHAFDAERVEGSTIFVRGARAGEKIVALNDESYSFGPSNLLIADESGPIAIAGVIGGHDSAIHEGTKRLILESANFLASSVRKTSVQLKLRTDASMRFEKAQDPQNTVRGLARAIALLRQVSPGIRIVGGLADAWRPDPAPAPIELPITWLERKLGRVIDKGQARLLLEALGFGVAETRADVFSITVPSWRATKDISLKDDLVEEVGRIIGYDSITPRAPFVAATVPPQDPQRLFFRKVRAIVSGQGLTEVSNYSFVNDEMVSKFGFDLSDHIRVLNPIASDQTLLRTNLLPRIFENIVTNSRHLAAFRLFEIGREIHKASRLPTEVPHLAAAIYANDDGVGGLFELKRLAECLMPECELQPAEPQIFEHPHRASTVFFRGEIVGRLFELHPSLGLEGRAAILDLDLSIVEKLDRGAKGYRPLRRFPTSAFDLSVVVAERTPAGHVKQELTRLAGPDLVHIEYLRQFPLPDGLASLSYRLTVGAQDRTLDSDAVAAIRKRVIEGVRRLGYELRL